MLITHRAVQAEDIPTICTFTENAQELYWCFPLAQFPLTEIQLQNAIQSRKESLVFLVDNQVVGFCNFPVVEKEFCFLGNVMIAKAFRYLGIGKYLVKTMCQIAFEKYSLSEFKVSCFNDNLNGLLLYGQFGFKPFGIEKRIDPQGQAIALIHFRLYREEFYKIFNNKNN